MAPAGLRAADESAEGESAYAVTVVAAAEVVFSTAARPPKRPPPDVSRLKIDCCCDESADVAAVDPVLVPPPDARVTVPGHGRDMSSSVLEFPNTEIANCKV